MSEQDVVFNLEVNVEKSASSLRQLEFIGYRAFGLLRRVLRLCGVSEDSDVMKAIQRLQRLVMTIRLAHTAILLLQDALVPGAGLLKTARAAVSVGTLAASSAEMVMNFGE